MLSIKNLKVSINGKEILKGVDLEVNAGEVHAIMGPNGNGKSTLANVIAGSSAYDITDGEIIYKGKNLFDLSVEERACEGIFLSFQYPVEIPGVSMTNFMKAAMNAQRKYHGKDPIPAQELLAKVEQKRQLVEITEKMSGRSVNEGYSGGEKKKNEIFQMALLEPSLAILDETDSGLDIDALRVVANGVNKLKTKDNAFILITHYQRLLDYIVPDFVHVLYEGRIVKSGGRELAQELEEKGYEWLKDVVVK